MRCVQPGIVAVVAAGVLFGCAYTNPHPTDAELRKVYAEQGATFRKLEDLFQQHADISFIGANVGRFQANGQEVKSKASGEWQYDEQPLAEFGPPLKSLQVKWGLQHCKQTPNQWMLFLNCRGLHPFSTCKGYIWSSDSLSPLLDSLEPPAEVDEYDRGYVKLDGNWYLLHEKWPGFDDRCLPRS